MHLTGTQIQWTAIVVGATCYFFMGALTELSFPILVGTFVGVAIVAPAVLTRSVSFQDPPAEDGLLPDSDDESAEYKF